jgi:AraC-like DNA-binding protein
MSEVLDAPGPESPAKEIPRLAHMLTAVFAPASNSGPIDELRQIIHADPARVWRAPDIARMVGLSEASLRRRLAVTGTSFSELLTDIRMTTAFALLKTTNRSVTQIAVDVGYDSASRFAVRFRVCFGVSPSEVRGHHRYSDRNGTKSDRNGAAPDSPE